jgi:hypothetical protein
MNALYQWAIKWGVSPDAIADLRTQLIAESASSPNAHGESDVLGRVRLIASEAGWRVFRNNVGACRTDDGRFLRYGLANESTRMNTSLKSSDIVGIRPLVIDPSHLGRTIGQFVALECKRPGWTFKNTKREAAQYRFLLLVESLGGHGRFSTGGLE